MQSYNPLVSILILNHNGKPFLEDCFKSIFNGTYPHFEVILIDNASTDDSVAFTKTYFPEVKIFETGSNKGYSHAYNLSFAQANGKYFLLLNFDVTVASNWLEPLVETAEKDETIGALQPKLVSMIDPTDFEYAGASGGFMDIYGFPFLRGRIFNHLEKDQGQYDDQIRIFWATGAALFLRASALNDTGVLDEDFFMHMEEIDLCWRLNLVGYQIQVVPQSKIYHYGGASLPAENFLKIYLNHRNSISMLLKNVGRQRLPKILLVRWLLDLLALIQALFKLELKRLKAIIASHWWILCHLKSILKKRESVQKLRKVPDETVFKMLYPKSIALQYFLKGKNTYNRLQIKGT